MNEMYKIASQESSTSTAVKETDWDKCIVFLLVKNKPSRFNVKYQWSRVENSDSKLVAFKKIDCLLSNKFPV